jgi:hypothetical protein
MHFIKTNLSNDIHNRIGSIDFQYKLLMNHSSDSSIFFLNILLLTKDIIFNQYFFKTNKDVKRAARRNCNI